LSIAIKPTNNIDSLSYNFLLLAILTDASHRLKSKSAFIWLNYWIKIRIS